MDPAQLRALITKQHDGDRQVLDPLRNAGSDLTKPAHILHYLYFKDRAGAEFAARDLRGKGFDPVRVHPTPGQSFIKRILGRREYSCIAETHAAPTPENVAASSSLMCVTAATLGGHYDGWEASVEQ